MLIKFCNGPTDSTLRSVLISRSDVIGNPSFSFSILSRFKATISSVRKQYNNLTFTAFFDTQK